jgi:hypothetical protein
MPVLQREARQKKHPDKGFNTSLYQTKSKNELEKFNKRSHNQTTGATTS